MKAFDQLVETVRQLRSDTGCPWDRAQTPASLRPHLLEETYEVLDAIDSDDPSALRDELGDLLFQILLMARMAEEADEFTLEDVTQAVNDKMIRRHPHVFDPHHQATGTEGSIETWEARKAKERSSDTSVLDGVPTTLPSLLRAYRITEKASRVGFDWPDFSGVRAKLDEEIGELDEACADGHPEAIGHEYGDLLLTVVNMGRFLPVTPEEALRGAVKRFEHRFRAVETALVTQGDTFHEATLDQLEALWTKAKEGSCF